MWTSFQNTLGRVLVITGALTFACWGYLMLHEFWFQRAATHVLQQQISDASGATPRYGGPLHGTLTKPSRGAIIGRLEIPRIDVAVVVLEGSDSSILGVAAGHIEGMALPGTIGNVEIAAHRDTFFRLLREVRPNDMISLRTLNLLPLSLHRCRAKALYCSRTSTKLIVVNHVGVPGLKCG